MRIKIAHALTWGITVAYGIGMFLLALYEGGVGAWILGSSSDDDESGAHGRFLQSNNTQNCEFPRPDGTYPPNPKCQSIPSLVSIPFINAVMAAGTNWVALKMTFYPTTFWGWEIYRFKDQPLGLFGWQGIIPTKAAKMAQKSVRMMTEKLFDVNEIFKRVDPKIAVERMKPGFKKVMDEVLDAQITRQFPPDSRFSSFVPTIKGQMMNWAEAEMPAFAEGFMQDLINSLDKVFDLEHMVVTEFTEDKMLLNKVFLTVGANELRFLVNSGYIFGFFFGLLFLPLWIFLPYWFILPIVGAFVGYITNEIALKMMFWPIQPHRVRFCCGRFTVNFQGLFLQRQQEASAVFAKLTVGQILNSRYMFHYMLNGPKRAEFRAMLVEHTNRYIDKVLGRAQTLVRAYLGEEEFNKMRKDIEEATMANVEDIFGSLYAYTDEALRLEEEIRTKMQGLPPSEFEGVLHPVFEEDEFKLIVVGGVLGMIVGFIQITFP